MPKSLSDREHDSLVDSLHRIEKKQASIQDTLNLSILEQGKANVHYQLGIKELRDRQEKTEKTILKNAPAISFAAKIQSNMSKIVTGLVIAVGGSWVVGSASNKAETIVKSEIVKEEAKND